MPQDYLGTSIPEDADTADGPAAFAEYTDGGPIPKFATAAARDAGIASPVTGMLCAVVAEIQRYTGTQWENVMGGLPNAFTAWTPAIKQGPGLVSLTASAGFYARLGRLVYWTANMATGTHSDAGNPEITNLPVAARTGGGGMVTGWVAFPSGGRYSPMGGLYTGTPAIRVFLLDLYNGAFLGQPGSTGPILSGTSLQLQGLYEAAAVPPPA